MRSPQSPPLPLLSPPSSPQPPALLRGVSHSTHPSGPGVLAVGSLLLPGHPTPQASLCSLRHSSAGSVTACSNHRNTRNNRSCSGSTGPASFRWSPLAATRSPRGSPLDRLLAFLPNVAGFQSSGTTTARPGTSRTCPLRSQPE